MKTNYLRMLGVVVGLQAGTIALGVQIPPHWTQVATTEPSARTFHAMAFDSQRGRTVLFSGNVGGADTWEWNGTGWLPQIFAFGPAARQHHALAYDSQRGRTVLFGGTSYLGNTWEWDGVAWARTRGSLNYPGWPPVGRATLLTPHSQAIIHHAVVDAST